jgi:hypothetical protein
MSNGREGERDLRRDSEVFEAATYEGNVPGSPSTAAVLMIVLILLIGLASLHLGSRYGPSHVSRSQPQSSAQ